MRWKKSLDLSVWSKITRVRVKGEREGRGRRRPLQGHGLAKEPETHRIFGRELFRPVSKKSLKLIPVWEGIKVYVL